MYFEKKKKETNLTAARKLKRKKAFKFSWNLQTSGKRHNFFIFFFKHSNIKLNSKLIINLIREELGVFYSINNWLNNYYKKTY